MRIRSARILSHRLHFIIPFVIEIEWPPIFSPSVSSGLKTFHQRYRILWSKEAECDMTCVNRRAGVNKSLNKCRMTEAHRTPFSSLMRLRRREKNWKIGVDLMLTMTFLGCAEVVDRIEEICRDYFHLLHTRRGICWHFSVPASRERQNASNGPKSA